jgi:CO/xanthine dehydrogenase FAD-binding subunit
MPMPQAEYHRPGSVEEATALLGEPGARPIAGGTDLMVQNRGGKGNAPTLVDLNFVPSLAELGPRPDGGLRIGATVRLARLESDRRCLAYPLLGEAAGTVGSIQIRNRATLAGNLCNASPAADTAPALLCYEAVVHVVGPAGRREVPLEEFWKGPGETTLRPGEWVEAVSLPPPPPHGGCYLKLGRTLGVDLAVAGVAALVSDAGVRLAAASVAPTPRRLRPVEAVLSAAPPGSRPDIGPAVAAAIAPIDDARATAAYRQAMTVVLARRAWEAAQARFVAREGSPR